jgi:hypothetical protein
MVVLPGPATLVPIDTGLPPELALLLWSLKADIASISVLHPLRPVGEGIAHIAKQHRRVCVAQEDENDTNVLEILKTLCADAYNGKEWTNPSTPRMNGDRRAHETISLDEILTTSRLLNGPPSVATPPGDGLEAF